MHMDDEYDDDFDEDEYFCDELFSFAKSFHSSSIEIAKRHIISFFKDKQLHCGGKIPMSLLLSRRRVSLVLNCDILSSLDIAYSCLEGFFEKEKLKPGGTTKDIILVNESLSRIAEAGIPQQFAGGILLLYLEFVEGVKIDS